jgi:magnesium-transporting ATPase (P-type)
MVVKDDKDSEKKVCIINTEWNLWINMNSQCLINWQCSYNIYETLWIRKSDQNPQVKTFVQDIILAVTMFLGTVIAIILVISGILYIMAAISWKSSMADMAKKGIINSMIWLLLVTWSYALVRLIQFVATAWWW